MDKKENERVYVVSALEAERELLSEPIPLYFYRKGEAAPAALLEVSKDGVRVLEGYMTEDELKLLPETSNIIGFVWGYSNTMAAYEGDSYFAFVDEEPIDLGIKELED